MQNMNCPICQNSLDRIFQKDGYWILECKSCHHRCAEIIPSNDHLNQVYQDDYFKGGAAGYPDYLSEAKILSDHGKRYGLMLKKYTTPGTLLDVGTAAGFILKGFQESDWQGIGLEPNSSMAEYGRTHLGLQIESRSLEQFTSNQRFDLVSMIQVIAHFFDIRQALQKAADATKPGGFWLIETWDRESWVARSLGRYWHEYSPPSVLHWFSPGGLNFLVAQFDFSEVARGRPAKRISGAHAKSLLGYKLQNFPLSWLRGGLKIIPDHLVIPYPTFDLFWILFQKSTNSD
jgi:SAM-dependent methyltransferase